MPEEVPGLQRGKPSLMVLGGGSLLARGSAKQTARVAAGGVCLWDCWSIPSAPAPPPASPGILPAAWVHRGWGWGLGAGEEVALSNSHCETACTPAEPPAAATAPRTRDAQPLHRWHWWVLRCGLSAPALPGWTTLLGWFVEAAGVQSCAPHGGRASCGCLSCTGRAGGGPGCVTLGFSSTSSRVLSGPARRTMLWACFHVSDWAAGSLPPSPCLAGGGLGFAAWQGPALAPPELLPCLSRAAQPRESVLTSRGCHVCARAGHRWSVRRLL